MSTPHPMWNAIKRGMALGALAGLNAAFLFTMVGNVPVYTGGLLSYTAVGGGTGLFFGALGGFIWRRMTGPLSRLESDLKAAAALYAKNLINESDYQVLKSRILAAYQPDPSGARTIISTAVWGGLIGVTIALGSMLSDYAPRYGDQFIGYLFPLTIVGILIGTAVAAIIQAGLQSKGTASLSAQKQAMLGAGQFDPLGTYQNSESQPYPKVAKSALK